MRWFDAGSFRRIFKTGDLMLARAVAFTAVLPQYDSCNGSTRRSGRRGRRSPSGGHAVKSGSQCGAPGRPASLHGGCPVFCWDVQKGGGKILKRLKGHEAELSAECKNAAVSLRAAGRQQGREFRLRFRTEGPASKAETGSNAMADIVLAPSRPSSLEPFTNGGRISYATVGFCFPIREYG